MGQMGHRKPRLNLLRRLKGLFWTDEPAADQVRRNALALEAKRRRLRRELGELECVDGRWRPRKESTSGRV